MTITRFHADHLITMAPTDDGAPAVHTPGVVDVEGGDVVWSGPATEAPAHDGDEHHIDGLLMPGLLDIHAHTPMLLLRGTGEGLPTDRWLTEVMWPRESQLSERDVFAAMQLGATELLRNGITTSSEMYFFPDAVARSAAAAGLRCIVACPLIEAATFSHFGTIDEQIEATRALRDTWRDHRTIEIAVGPHAAYTLSREALGAVADLVRDDPMLVHIHVAEQRGEAAAVERESGRTVPGYLDEIGLLAPRTVAAHCVWVTAGDIELLAARRVGVAHCPCSNGRHASGIAPVEAMRASGINVGIATDGPASHDRLDLFEDVRTAARFARILAKDASPMSAATLLGMVTREAADAVGRSDLGRLTPGARADMMAIDIEADGFDPVLAPDALVGRVVWAGNRAAVRSVWVDGTPVVVDGRCTTIDHADARRRVLEIARRLAR
jgi:5-methylthioadenosine/S-adenosylhomocysteine deaminase